jgi:hypothetical protein
LHSNSLEIMNSSEKVATPVEEETSIPLEEKLSTEIEYERLEPLKPYEFGFLKIPNYYTPTFQVFIAGFVNFLAVGMYI